MQMTLMPGSDSEVWRGIVDVGDCRLHVALDGSSKAPPLMLSNSLGSDLTMWDPQDRRHFLSGSASSVMTRGATVNRMCRKALTPWSSWHAMRWQSLTTSASKRRTGVACRWVGWRANGLAPTHLGGSTS